jgi:hypothetical protein
MATCHRDSRRPQSPLDTTYPDSRQSQAVDFDPSEYGAMVTPSNSFGYVNGDAQDMRTRH